MLALKSVEERKVETDSVVLLKTASDKQAGLMGMLCIRLTQDVNLWRTLQQEYYFLWNCKKKPLV